MVVAVDDDANVDNVHEEEEEEHAAAILVVVTLAAVVVAAGGDDDDEHNDDTIADNELDIEHDADDEDDLDGVDVDFDDCPMAHPVVQLKHQFGCCWMSAQPETGADASYHS